MEIKGISRRDFLTQRPLARIARDRFGKSDTQPSDSNASLGEKFFFEKASITHIGEMTLEELRDQYHSELFGRFLPNMDRLVVDHQYGGFMCSLDLRRSEQLSSAKSAWGEGRGIWVYSFLYNNLDKNPHYLEIAQKSKDFILKHKPTGGNFWTASYTREGSPLSGPGDIFGNLYIAEGLAEFSKAAGDKRYLALAREINLEALRRYDQPDYRYPSEKKIRGPRLLNHWMVLLRNATQLLEYEPDPEIEALARRCIEAIMHDHLNPDFNLLNQTLTHDFRPITEPGYRQSASIGIGIQTLWMVFFEAIRKNDVGLFQKAQELFKRHVEVARDRVYGGYFNVLDQVDNFIFGLNKVQSVHVEVLNGSLALIEHLGDPWANQSFAATYAYMQHKFVHPELAFAIESGNRQLTRYPTNRMGNYHYPRHLMMSLVALNRMIASKA
jgi:mannose/cellobiose epimerase-like protein (N-acyl-D-glucosamine 2-epimerase family)